MRFTEKELKSLLKKNSAKTNVIKIEGKSSENSNKTQKVTNFSGDKVKSIIEANVKSTIKFSVSKDSLTILFVGAKLITLNQIFSILQNNKYDIFKYKKSWHNIVYEALLAINGEVGRGGMPFFSEKIELTLYRQGVKLVDEDSFPAMFKFILDGLKRSDSNKFGVIEDDNPNIISTIKTVNQTGEPFVGISIKRVPDAKVGELSIDDILNENMANK